VATATMRNWSPKQSEQLIIPSTTQTITELEILSPNRQATLIYLDQLPWRMTATKVVKTLELTVGKRYQSGALSRQVLDKEKQLAMELSLQLLSYRIRSRREIGEKLEKRKISTEAIGAALAKLEQAGYINDNAFAKAWIDERIEIHGYGRRRIKSELLTKGIDDETIESELDRLYTAEKEIRAARELAGKRLARYVELDKVVAARRLTQVLMRRGFSAKTARTVLKDLLA